MLNWLPNGIKTWVVVGVGALVLALSAFFILSNFSPDSTFAHDPDDVPHQNTFHAATPPIVHAHYAENGTGPVMTLSSMDPEGATIAWDVTGVDAASFTISNGVLMFMSPPDFEDPMDRDVDLTQADDQDAREDADDNNYQITVRATERRASGYMGPAKWSSTDVTVIVTNEDEDGMVELNRLQPEVEGTDTTIPG